MTQSSGISRAIPERLDTIAGDDDVMPSPVFEMLEEAKKKEKKKMVLHLIVSEYFWSSSQSVEGYFSDDHGSRSASFNP
jgi:hypothetical protein